LEHKLEAPKLELDQNAPNHESALPFLLPRGYHDLANRFCLSNSIQDHEFVLFQE